MIADTTSHRVFKISELTRLITSHLLTSPRVITSNDLLTSRKAVVNLACACRYLEEPVLSTLWGIVASLERLLRVLPRETWDRDHLESGENVFRIVGDPSQEDWKRVHRYASWMRCVTLDEHLVLEEATPQKFRLNSPADGWFPTLQNLSWCITESNLSYVDLIFSPHLKKISIHVPLSWSDSGVPNGVFPAIASTISMLSTSALQSISVGNGGDTVPWTYLKDSFSSVILRCGSSLTKFGSPTPLTNAAIYHLIQLPRLRSLWVGYPPPNYSASSLPFAFSPLTKLTLRGDVARGWISLLKHAEDHFSATQGVTPLSQVKGSLESLRVEATLSPLLDVSFTSRIQMFCNLVTLDIGVRCHDESGEGQCAFELDDDDAAELAMALPQLKHLFLGPPCFENTCATTVACLLPIAVYCPNLKELQIHFNTENIVDDLEEISENPRFRELQLLPRCTLTYLDVWETPLIVGEDDFETVVDWMAEIFPSLELPREFGGSWDKVGRRIAERRTEGHRATSVMTV